MTANKYPFLSRAIASMSKFDASPFDLDEMIYDLEMLVEYEIGKAGKKYIADGEGQRTMFGEV